jgi:tetratricopeptide (TPR) repeat protein
MNIAFDDPARFVEDNQRAEEAIDRGDLPTAAAILVKIVEKEPNNWRAYNNLGIISWMQKAWEDAYVMFKRSVELKPDYTDALMNFFDACIKLRRMEQGLPFFQKALQLNPQDEEIRIIVESILSQGKEIYLSERALKIGIFDPRIEEATRLLDAGKLNEATAKFLEINDTSGPDADVYCGLGIISYYQKKYKDAFSLFLESIKLNPTSTDTFLNLLDAAQMEGIESEAKKIYALYVEQIPSLASIGKEFQSIS